MPDQLLPRIRTGLDWIKTGSKKGHTPSEEERYVLFKILAGEQYVTGCQKNFYLFVATVSLFIYSNIYTADRCRYHIREERI